MPSTGSVPDIAALNDKLLRLGTRFADDPGLTAHSLAGEVIGLMDASGYTAEQCTAMMTRIPSLLDNIRSQPEAIVPPAQFLSAMSTTLANKPPFTNFARNAAASTSRVSEGAQSWLRRSDSGRSSASYETESASSFESLPSRGRSRDRRHYSHREHSSRHGRSDSNHHRRPIPRQSSHTRRGSVDTRYHRSSRSGKPKKSWGRKMLDSFRSRGRSVRFSE